MFWHLAFSLKKKEIDLLFVLLLRCQWDVPQMQGYQVIPYIKHKIRTYVKYYRKSACQTIHHRTSRLNPEIIRNLVNFRTTSVKKTCLAQKGELRTSILGQYSVFQEW